MRAFPFARVDARSRTRACTIARMGIASIPTKLPLATFAQIAGIHPLHFEQIEFTPDGRSPNLCGETILQHPWQEGDRISREDVARCIAVAEDMLEEQLQFHLIPTWETNEKHLAVRFNQPEMFYAPSSDIRWRGPIVTADWKKLITGGIEARVLLANAAITWSDADGDGIDDTGTVTAPCDSGQSACEIEVYYPGHDGDPAYQIRPATASVTGTTATVQFKKQLCVLEDILGAYSPGPAQWDTNDDFLESVDVYRHYNDPSQQATLIWEPGTGCQSCNGSGCTRCQYATQTACLYLRSTPEDAVLSWAPGTWNAVDRTFDSSGLSGSPDQIELFYQAGLRRKTGCPMVMDDAWARTVTYLGLSMLERTLCDCSNNTWQYWKEDLMLTSGNDQDKVYFHSRTSKQAENPFGTRRGAVYAWERVRAPGVVAVRSATLT